MNNPTKRHVVLLTGPAMAASLLGAMRRAQPTADVVVVDGVRRVVGEPAPVKVDESLQPVNALGYTEEQMAAHRAKADAAAERQRRKVARQAKGMTHHD